MNSHHHSRDDKELIIVAFEGDVCPYCELLKKCARLEKQVKLVTDEDPEIEIPTLSEPIFWDLAEEYKAFGGRFDSIENRLTRVERQIKGGSQAEAIDEKLGDLARDNVVLTRFLEKELDLLLKSNVDVVSSSCHRDSTVRLGVHCLRCGHDQYVLAEDTGVTLKCENPAGCTNRFRVERQEQETG